MRELTDWRGTPITIGSTIVYPGRMGSGLWINEGVVKGVVENTGYSAKWNPVKLKVERTGSNEWRGKDINKKIVTISNVDNVTVVTSPDPEPSPWGLTVI